MHNFSSISSAYHSSSSSMSISGIQGHLLEVTVVGCNKLRDTEWFSRQDPYVCVEYGSNRNRTRTCTDGGKNPTFQDKFSIALIEGLREINIAVWNSNSVTTDDFIGSGKVQLEKVLTKGYDDSTWGLQSKTGRYAGEVKLIMHYDNNKLGKNFVPSAPPYGAPVPQVSLYSAPPPASAPSYPPPAAAYPTLSPYPSAYPNTSAYPPSAYPSAYSPSPYPSAYPPPPSAYPPPPPTSAYPPPPYPPPPQTSPYYPPGPFPGHYPPHY